jgi:hypothetical protein
LIFTGLAGYNLRVDTYDLVMEGLGLLRGDDTVRVTEYLERIRNDDPLAWDILDFSAASLRSRFPEAIKKGAKLLPRVSGDLRLSEFLFNTFGVNYGKMGELSTAENYFIRALEIAEITGEPKRIGIIRMNLFSNAVYMAEYEYLHKECREIEKSGIASIPSIRYNLDYILAIVELTRGRPDRALKKLDFLAYPDIEKTLWRRGMEMGGLVLRMLGKLQEARGYLISSAQDYADFGDTYAPFPCAKALQLTRLAGLEPPPRSLIRKALSLGKKGSWGSQAATQEIEALLLEEDNEASENLFSAAQGYRRTNQPLEACLAGLSSAFLAWKANAPVFPAVLRFLAPIAPLHSGFKQDPLIGRFFQKIEPLLSEETKTEEGIRAYLIGGLRVYANGEEICPMKWYSKKATKALMYLLLTPQHRIAKDHLFYLLWPRRNFNSKNSVLLYTAINFIRRNLVNRDLLTSRHDFYQLEDTWTDLGEIENLMRLADTTRDPAEREGLLARASELVKGDLLPELPYDRQVEEYRYYYERLRKRLFGNETRPFPPGYQFLPPHPLRV